MTLTRLCVGVASASIIALASAPASARSCESLARLALPETTITLAESHAAGPFTPPGSPTALQLPAFCRVAGVVQPAVRFEVWLPAAAAWNKKFQGVGNGGLAGTIGYGALADGLTRNYATASTDTGHQVTKPDGIWALGHPEAIVDFAYRATHEMTVKGKAITGAFYGSAAELSYFVGCSKGGQQALMEAQRFPDDYDGIIAGDPANFWTHHYLGGHLWPALAMLRDRSGAHYISPAKLPALSAAVNAKCDAMDGVVDGVLNDPRRCNFDPSVLLCTGTETASCLTAPQIQALRDIYAGPGKELYPGILPGGETGPGGWQAWITGTSIDQPGSHLGLGIPFFKYFIFDDPTWDFHTLNFTSDVTFTDNKRVNGVPMAEVINAVDADLRPFRANGAKLIHYHGFSDSDIAPVNSINYFESVTKVMGDDDDAQGLRKTQQFYRLFMVPGMQHCRGGPGADRFDALTALERWVETGAAPERILASHVENGATTFTRPLCPYPQQATYIGRGETSVAANFVCERPPDDGDANDGSSDHED